MEVTKKKCKMKGKGSKNKGTLEQRAASDRGA